MEQFLMMLLVVLTVILPKILFKIGLIISLYKKSKKHLINSGKLKVEDDYRSVTVGTDNKLIRKVVFLLILFVVFIGLLSWSIVNNEIGLLIALIFSVPLVLLANFIIRKNFIENNMRILGVINLALLFFAAYPCLVLLEFTTYFSFGAYCFVAVILMVSVLILYIFNDETKESSYDTLLIYLFLFCVYLGDLGIFVIINYLRGVSV